MTEEEKKKLQGTPAPEMETKPVAAPESTEVGVNEAMGALEANKRPGFTSSYDGMISDLFGQIMNRPAFQYDVGTDPLFQALNQQYTNLGKMAMRDTMGQAAALTGGYGSSYGQAVGQQTYDRYLQELTGFIPELEGKAYGRYQDEGNLLMQQLGLADDMADDEYNKYWNEREYNFNYLMELMNATGYTPTAEEMAAAGMTQEQVDAILNAWRIQNPGLYGQLYGGVSGGGGSGGRGWNLQANGTLDEDQIKEMQRYYGVTADGMWGPESSRAAGYLSVGNAWDRYQSETGGGGGDSTDTGNYEIYRGLMQGVQTAGNAQNASNYINSINPSDLATLSNAQFESLVAATEKWKDRR